MIKKIVSTIALMMCFAVSLSAADILGSVVDPDGEPLIKASVRLLNAKDSAFVKGVMTDVAGKFTIPSVKNGRYIVEASYIGFANGYTPTAVSGKNVQLPTITLSQSGVLLKEVSVVGVKTPVKVMEDTVEFNADSYKTAPNAVVEDLLKRLPGVEVGSDGKITSNGKSVSKILIDGKEFFGDDPTVASKNLPVDMVEKLQVVDRKSDLARLTGVDDGEDETVINLTIKRGMNNGWFGNAEAGYGTDDRYKAIFNVNRFWNGNQITLLGNANNINELGFGDGGAGRFRRFGGDNGLSTSQALGMNFNVGNGEKFRVGGNVMWNRSNRNTIETHERTNFINGAASTVTNSGRHSLDRGQNVRADFRIIWNPDSFNTLDIRPRLSWNHNHSFSSDSSFMRNGDLEGLPVNRSLNTGDTRGNSWEYGLQMIYNHKFRLPGRSMSIMANYSHSNLREYDDSYSRNIFYQFGDSTDIYDQYSDNHTWNNSLRARASWTEPIGDIARGNFLTFAYGVNARWNDADKLVYDLATPEATAVALDEYRSSRAAWLLANDPLRAYAEDVLAAESADMVFNSTLSNRFRNDFFSQDIRIGYKHVDKATNLEAGLSLVPTMSKSVNLINDAKSIPTRWVWNFAPFLRYRYKFSKQRSLQANYRGRSSQPSMNQLQPVADMSDPLRIVVGNPNLDPSFSHNIMFRYQDFDQKSQRSLMLMANFTIEQNSIVSRTDFDASTGGRITTYANVNGVWSGRLMNMFTMPLRNKKWTISNHVFGMYNRNVGFTNGLRNASSSLRASEMFSISFRPDNVELSLRPRYSLQYTYNPAAQQRNTVAHSFGGTFDAYYYTPIGIILNTDLTLSATRGYAQNYNQDQWMWNASISYQFLRGKAATVTLKAYDLLQQKKNISRSEAYDYIDDASYNALTRYFMVTFAYRFNTFGDGKRPSAAGSDMMRQGPPGDPGGPGGHGGPGGRRF